jgi:hypothetical protein
LMGGLTAKGAKDAKLGRVNIQQPTRNIQQPTESDGGTTDLH